MWDLLETLCMMVLPIVFFWVLFNPEEAAEKLGRCIAAFRRGLEGKTSDQDEQQPSSQQEPPVRSANQN